jgi:phosphatidylethanolamine/phosphatidyl-N-methylethanolamine N-methyltransferase
MNLKPGQRVLEVGVGTGLSLAEYPNDVKVTGIDISAAMLDKARDRIERRKLSQVEALEIMDAQSMTFEDSSFDAVISMYIMSVVPDPVQVIREMGRVCRPGGSIVVVNYFRTHSQKVRWNEWVVKPLCKMFHFRFGLSLEAFTQEAQLDVIETLRANIFNHTTVLHCRNNGATH